MRKLALNNVLTLILRLKQACNSPLLTVSNMKRFNGIRDVKSLNIKMRELQKDTEEDCPICYDVLADTIAEPCGHRCCEKCWNKLFDNGISKCPVCRTSIIKLKFPQQELSDSESDSELDSTQFLSSKIKMVLSIIKEKIKKGEKIIIVSQWVKFLDILQTVFDKYNMKYITLRGNIPMKRRFEYITQFENDKSVKVCFVSMLSSAEGINLISANNMIIVDNWWNSAKIIQVMDRIHRIGQKRDVNIYKLQVENTIEERIQELVDKKYKVNNLISNKWSVGDDYNTDWMKSIVKLIVTE
jgi:SWI/SNF-related matrix-associated actin-dependent regulator of chromatin subfamily A3